jgi:RNA polymerase sigma-70 factor (ECF subfamily)
MLCMASGAARALEDLPAAALERGDARETVREALRRLPEPQREALVLADWGGMTADQIARREQVPLGTAKSRIRLGMARLRQECPALALDAA